MLLRNTFLILGLLTLAFGTTAQAQVTVSQVDYHGWTGAYRLANASVELVYVPQIGRIMRYAYLGGPNVLWENPDMAGKTTDLAHLPTDWQNYGGDKCWPAPQSRWGWPPDPTMDSGPATVVITPQHHLRVVGKASTRERVLFEREIMLDAHGSGVTLKNTLVNTGDKADTWAVWEIAQTDDPDLVRMPLYRKGAFKNGYHIFGDSPPAPGILTLTDREAHMKRDAKSASKIGGDSPQGWIIAEKAGQQFQASLKPEGRKPYPDDGCALEIYTSNDPNKYVEVELLGPLTRLAPNAQTTLVTHWKLARK